MKHSLGEPQPMPVPDVAYGRDDVYHMGTDDAPRQDVDYRQYKFLGRYPVRSNMGDSTTKVRARARKQYGPRANVFMTARWWVVYEVA